MEELNKRPTDGRDPDNSKTLEYAHVKSAWGVETFMMSSTFVILFKKFCTVRSNGFSDWHILDKF